MGRQNNADFGLQNAECMPQGSWDGARATRHGMVKEDTEVSNQNSE
jgi:hypothetical protein